MSVSGFVGDDAAQSQWGNEIMKKGQSRRDVLLGGAAGLAAANLGAGQRARAQQASPGTDGQALPRPDPEFKGKIGPTVEDSKPDYPLPVRAPQGAPNVLMILLDDVGFGMASTFGGPVPTPNMDKLAKERAEVHPLPHDRACAARRGRRC